MTLLTAAVVTLVVGAVSLVRSLRLRALIYSLPLPITLVLVTTHLPVGAEHLLGVVLLNVFVAVVAWLHHRLGWHILLADAGGIAVYVGGGWAVLHVRDLPFVPVLAGTLAAWAVAVAVQRRAPAAVPPAGEPPRHRLLPTLGKLSVVGVSALLVVGLGQLLRSMVVTFPYAGVLVVIETRRDLVEFRAQFTRASVVLLAFLTGYHFTQGISPYVALAAGWAAFLACAVALHLTRGQARTPAPA